MDDFKPEDVAWIILSLPLLAAAAIGLFTKRDGKFSAQLSISAVVLTFLVSCGVFAMFREALLDTKTVTKLVTTTPINWLNIGDLKVEIGLRLDPLSLLMLLAHQRGRGHAQRSDRHLLAPPAVHSRNAPLRRG